MSDIEMKTAGEATQAAAAPGFASRFEYVMVFPYKDKQQSAVAKHTCKVLLERGLELFSYLSVQNDEQFVLIHCPEKVLRSFADNIDLELELDPVEAQRMLEAGDAQKHIAPSRITHDPRITPLSPYTYIFSPYDDDMPDALFRKNGDDGSLFGAATKLKTLYSKLEGPARLGGCNLPIQDLLKHGELLAFYPLHLNATAQKLQEKMLERRVMPWTVPINELRSYFGEKVALYFAFLGNYSYFLLLPAIVGLALQLVVWGTDDYSSPVLPFFGVFICGWAIVMLESWKRMEYRVAMRWGMNNYEAKELDRPQFKGKLIRSYVNGQEMRYFPSEKRIALIFQSMTVIGTLICMVIGCVAGIYILRFQLQNSAEAPYASLIASVLNTVQIQFFNAVYQRLAVQLTRYENHRTDTEYEDSMITKLFAFQFINSYASFFFLGFVASFLEKPTSDDIPTDWVGQCGAPTCMTPLAINIAIIFGTRITITTALELLAPYIAYTSKREKETKGIAAGVELTRPEEDYMLLPYDIMQESITNYADTAIQYGFMVLFVTALPISCLFALVSNVVKVRANAWKLFSFYQRPIPKGVEDIGSWQGIFTFISVIAVITNGALICFTMNVIKGFTMFGRSWIFIGFQWSLIFAQFAIGYLIPDKPRDVEIQEARNEYLTAKLVEKVADEDFDPSVVIDLDAPLVDDVSEAKLLKRLKKQGAKDLSDMPLAAYPHKQTAGAWPALVTSTSTNDIKMV